MRRKCAKNYVENRTQIKPNNCKLENAFARESEGKSENLLFYFLSVHAKNQIKFQPIMDTQPPIGRCGDGE